MNAEEDAAARPGLGRLRAAVRPLLGVASLVFIVFAGQRLASQWQSGMVSVDLPMLLLSALPLAFGAWILALGWKWTLDRMVGMRVPAGPAIVVHLESQMARYTPGKVGLPMVRMAGARRLGVPAAAAGYSVLIETISVLACGGMVGFACLFASSGQTSGVLRAVGRLGALGFAAFAALAFVLVFVDRRRLPASVLRALSVEGTGALVPRRAPLTHIAYWLSWAVHGYCASRAVGISASHALLGAGLYVLAPIVGLLAVAAPSGIGVREAVLSTGLASVAGAAPALASALVSRAVSLGVDVLSWALARLAERHIRP